MSTSSTSASGSISGMSAEQKLVEAARRAVPRLPAGVQREFEALFSPTNLAVTTAVLGLWAGSHALGVGFAVDVLILLLGVVTLGWSAVQAAEKLRLFVAIAAQARSEAELDRAAAELADVVALLGVTVVTTLILKRAGRSASNRAAVAGRVARRQRIVQALGAKAQNPSVRARIATALDYYERAFPGWDEKRLAGHLRGTDWSSPVEVVTLKKGTRVVGFKQAGEAPLSGNYFSRSGASPRNLGIADGGRQHFVYEVTRDIEVLESRTAGVRDTWSSGRTSSFPGTDPHRSPGRPGPLGERPELVSGGQTQLVIPDASTMLRVVPKP